MSGEGRLPLGLEDPRPVLHSVPSPIRPVPSVFVFLVLHTFIFQRLALRYVYDKGSGLQPTRPPKGVVYVSRTVGPLPDKTCAQPTHTYLASSQLIYTYPLSSNSFCRHKSKHRTCSRESHLPATLLLSCDHILDKLQPRSGSERILFRSSVATEPSSGIHESGLPATMPADFQQP